MFQVWSAPAERSAEGALDLRTQFLVQQIRSNSPGRWSRRSESAVGASLCRRTPNFLFNYLKHFRAVTAHVGGRHTKLALNVILSHLRIRNRAGNQIDFY